MPQADSLTHQINVALIIVRLKRYHHFLGARVMAGEIRQRMDGLRRARATMVDGLTKEIDAVAAELEATHKDGLDALSLPKGEIAAYRKEIQEIREEFAPLTNGGPSGPLPDAPAGIVSVKGGVTGLAPTQFMPKVQCARCNRPVDKVTWLGPGLVRVECHGETKDMVPGLLDLPNTAFA